MAAALSLDLRRRIMADVDSGMTFTAVAEKYSVGCRTVYDLRKLREQTGSIKPRPAKTGPKLKLEDRKDEILTCFGEDAELTLEGAISKLKLGVGIATLWRALRRWGFSYKKRDTSRRTTAV